MFEKEKKKGIMKEFIKHKGPNKRERARIREKVRANCFQWIPGRNTQRKQTNIHTHSHIHARAHERIRIRTQTQTQINSEANGNSTNEHAIH